MTTLSVFEDTLRAFGDARAEEAYAIEHCIKMSLDIHVDHIPTECSNAVYWRDVAAQRWGELHDLVTEGSGVLA